MTRISRKTSETRQESNSIRDWMLLDLAASGLDADDAEALGLRPYTAEESAALNLSRIGSGFEIPYFDATGKRLSMFRYRYQVTEHQSGFLEGAKLRKYDQPAGTDPEIYLPMLGNVNWPEIMKDTGVPVIITEGEKKAACGTKHIGPTIGVGGVYSFGRKARYQTLLPTLLSFKWSGRKVYICYDSDAVTNRLVLTAENRLARHLTDRGAFVRIVRIPPEHGSDKKVALDDYVHRHHAEGFKHLMDSSDEYGPFEALHQLNVEVIHIQHPSMILEFPKLDHPPDQPRYRLMPVAKFVRENYADRKYSVQVNGKPTWRSTAADWIEWPAHRKADSATFAPGEDEIVGGQFNMWEGWGAQPVPGDVSLFLKLFNHITQGMEPDHKRWITQWFAYPIQHPGVRMNTAVVMWSTVQGSGKSILGQTMKGIYGQGFKEINQRDIEGMFNPWMKFRQFVLADEIAGNDSRKLADWLKSVITAGDISINEKFIPHFTIRNRINYYFTSNHPDAFFLENHDRRFFIFEITAPRLDEEFFTAYGRFIESEAGRNALMDYFLKVDLTGFNPFGDAPETASKREMKEQSRSAVEQWAVDLYDCDNTDRMLRSDHVLVERDIFTANELLAIYERANPSAVIGGASVLKAKGMSTALKKAGFKRTADSVEIPNAPADKPKKARLWVIRNRETNEKLTDTGKAALYALQAGYAKKKRKSAAPAVAVRQ